MAYRSKADRPGTKEYREKKAAEKSEEKLKKVGDGKPRSSRVGTSKIRPSGTDSSAKPLGVAARSIKKAKDTAASRPARKKTTPRLTTGGPAAAAARRKAAPKKAAPKKAAPKRTTTDAEAYAALGMPKQVESGVTSETKLTPASSGGGLWGRIKKAVGEPKKREKYGLRGKRRMIEERRQRSARRTAKAFPDGPTAKRLTRDKRKKGR